MSTFKKLLRHTAVRSRLTAPLRNVIKPNGTVLLYHRVVPQNEIEHHSHLDGLCVSLEDFEKQIELIATNYEPLSADEFCRRLYDEQLSPRSTLITFDDGYKDNLTYALPVLEKYRVPALIFISPGIVEKRAFLWWYALEYYVSTIKKKSIDVPRLFSPLPVFTEEERRLAILALDDLMKGLQPEHQKEVIDTLEEYSGAGHFPVPETLNWEEVHTLNASPMITIGSHTVNHYSLSRLSSNEVQNEMTICRENIKLFTGDYPDYLAYPFGCRVSTTDREAQIAEKVGYRLAFTTQFKNTPVNRQTNPFMLPRMAVVNSDSFEDFELKLSGISSLVYNHRLGKVKKRTLVSAGTSPVKESKDP